MAEDNGTAPEAKDIAGDKTAPGGTDATALETEVADLKDRLARSLPRWRISGNGPPARSPIRGNMP